MARLTRKLMAWLAVLALVVGGLALAQADLPRGSALRLPLEALQGELLALARQAGLAEAASELGRALERAAAGLVAAGLVLVAALFATRLFRPHSREAEAPASPSTSRADRKLARRIERRAQGLARKGELLEAAELCFEAGLLDPAARYFTEAGELVRAAEIRHDQNRFREAAELYERAGDPESAATVFASQGEWADAARCFLAAGRRSVAAEMFEKAGRFREAGENYAAADFHRHAAQAFLRCQAWAEAARELEQVIVEEGGRASAGGDAAREAELRKMVLQAGKLYEQAGDLERAEAVLTRGGCAAAAAEIALRRERYARASELFLEAGQPLRAAEALERIGERAEAARIRAEVHRDRGEDEQAARCFEQAGEFSEAGDLFRKLERYLDAGRCYEQWGDPGQAAEMYRLAGDLARAAVCFEHAERFAEAAACYAELGDGVRQAELLARAGRLLEAGRLYREAGRDDEAIKVLQEIPSSSPDYRAASALLGEVFEARGMLSVAVKKLRQALGEDELDRDNLHIAYTLARVHEANGELREAVEFYEKILAFDYHYRDVEARLTAARSKLRTLPQADPTRSGSSGSLSSGSSASSGRYRILSELGRGGMGIVYKARDTVLDRIVAYKVLPDALKENPQALRNFLREAKSAAQLNHPNIVTVYDAGEQDGRYYIAMEYVEGTTLKRIVRERGPISPKGVLHVLLQMCEALAYAHDKKIIHRDIKTANTMWTRDRKAKIMDFGLAKVVEEVRNHTTLVSGTPYYMSPEQTLGRNVDHRTDIYSLGVTLFELATGTLPFQEGNIPYHHVHTPAPDPRERNPRLPELLARIIQRCLRKDPDERYGSAREIVREVREELARGRSGSAEKS